MASGGASPCLPAACPAKDEVRGEAAQRGRVGLTLLESLDILPQAVAAGQQGVDRRGAEGAAGVQQLLQEVLHEVRNLAARLSSNEAAEPLMRWQTHISVSMASRLPPCSSQQGLVELVERDAHLVDEDRQQLGRGLAVFQAGETVGGRRRRGRPLRRGAEVAAAACPSRRPGRPAPVGRRPACSAGARPRPLAAGPRCGPAPARTPRRRSPAPSRRR